ncbi:MAG: hypothetical protein ACI4F6_04685 [Acutalibacteraceae bacterium]
MKKSSILIIALALIISLAGCTKQKQRQTESESPPAVIQTVNAPSVMESGDDRAAEESETTAITPNTETSPPSLTEPVQTAEERKTESSPAAAESPKQDTAPQPPKQTESSKPADTTKPVATAEPTEPPKAEEPKPTEPPAAAETPKETETTALPAPAFNIDYWIGYAQSYAQNAGLRLESSAVDCWDNPISANAKCKYLERDIKSRLDFYAKDNEITDVWIWAEEIAPDSYELYIGYA